MPSEFFPELQAAAAEGHSNLAQMQGMSAGGTNTLLASGVNCFGVYDYPQIVDLPLPGGGYHKRTETRLSITRAQLDKAPIPRTKLVRTDLPERITYTIDRVDTQEALVYLLTLVSFAP